MRKVIEKMKSMVGRILMGASLTVATTAPSYGAITDIGENAGTWIQEQGSYIALGIVVVILIKFLMKKAWIPAAAFLAIGGILLFVISSPDSLQTIGQSLYNLLVK